MRAILISTMLTTASAFGGAAYGQDTAVDSATSVAEATANIQDGKTDVNDVRYHYLLARGGSQTVVLNYACSPQRNYPPSLQKRNLVRHE
jgi:hypothetical protein